MCVSVFFFVARVTGNTPNDILTSYLNSYIGYSCRRPSLSYNQVIARHPHEPSFLLRQVQTPYFSIPGLAGGWMGGCPLVRLYDRTRVT